MALDLQTLRRQLLDEVQFARQAGVGRHLHLLYTPELHDPLGLVGDARRPSAVVRPAVRSNVAAARLEKAARLITLDCRRVAPYLEETDPALDDPAFEASITQCHLEVCSGQSRDKLVRNDEAELSEFSIAGWLVSTEDAATLAARLNRFSPQNRGVLAWSHPAVIHALWPTMNATQRVAMLGGATWLALSLDGILRRYAAPAGNSGADAAGAPRGTAGNAVDAAFDARQVRMTRNVQLVRDLMKGWHSICQSDGRQLPESAEQLVHAHVIAAQDHGLDSDSVAVYAMTLVQMKDGASADAEWRAMMRAVADRGYALRDQLAGLSDAFWERYVSGDAPLAS